jgi:2-polyprenyl-6-methoxyphenol hydroxylase-like FAD-dependent oxidoreductase
VGEIGRELGAPDTGISRRDLHRILVEAVGREAIEAGARCVGFVQDEDGVTARFESGREERGDVLVGADGARSAIRAQVHGAKEPRYAGYTQWQALADAEAAGDLLPAGVERVVFGRGARAVLHHVGRGELFWAGAVHGPVGGGELGAEPKVALIERFARWQDPIAAAVEATPAERIVGLDIFDRDPVGAWVQGRVALLGDAAHLMTTNLSQGCCQALEDAVVLARCLESEDGVAESLRIYEGRRAPRTTPLVKRSRRVSAFSGWKNPLACAARDRVLARMLSGPGLRDHRKLVAEAP